MVFAGLLSTWFAQGTEEVVFQYVNLRTNTICTCTLIAIHPFCANKHNRSAAGHLDAWKIDMAKAGHVLYCMSNCPGP